LLLPGAILAQDTPADAPSPVTTLSQEDVDEIIVTGSRIARPELTAMSPFAVLGEQEIELSNQTNIENFLRTSPQFAQALGSNTNNGNEGSATVDLRGLGEERTLVLVNGKRFVPYDYQGFVDLSMIPTALIERVEVITGGASAVYGADAVAGVVNFIMKDKFEGLEINGSYGITEEGDGDTYDFSVTAGGNFAGGRGNIVFNAGYTKADPISQGDRPYADPSLDDFLQPQGSFNTPEGSTLYAPFGDADCAQWGPDSNPLDNDCGATFNFAPYNLYQVPQEKWTATALGSYEINESVEFFIQGTFANNRVDTAIAPASTFGEPFTINTDNPLLTPAGAALFQGADAADGTPDGLTTFLFFPRFIGLGPRVSEYENTAYQFVGGFRGSIWEDQNWEVFGQYGRTSRNQNFFGDLNKRRFQESLIVRADADGNFCDSNNNGVRDTLDNAACVPGNYFGVQPTVEMQEFMGLDLLETNKTDRLIGGASLSGNLGDITIPTAESPLGYAVGVEFRREKGEAKPDKNFEDSLGPGFGSSSPVDAEIEIREVFGELLIPLVANAPLAHSINFETGIRYARYENVVTTPDGTTDNTFYNDTYKFGADWSPVEQLRFSATYQRAVRAPNMYEIGLPKTPGTGDLDDDPCDNDFDPGEDPSLDPDLTALCEATGVPVGLVGQFPSIIVGQIGNFSGGNPELLPEEADTWTYGLDWTPSFLEGLSISIDYYDIEIEDAITQLLEQDIVDGCYFVEMNAAGEFCQLIERSTLNGSLNAGSTVGVFRSYVNSASETASGIDFDIRYGFELGAGAIDLGLAGNYLLERKSQPADFLDEYDCAGLVGETCLRPAPELTIIQTTRWTSGPVTLQLLWRYIDEVTKDSVAFGDEPATNYAVPKIASQSYFDLSGTYDFSETWTMRAGITNLLDRDPPIVGTSYGGTSENSGNTFPATYPSVGRGYYVGLDAHF
jgi:outer membrane receptor protein involved in Fe transport